MLVMAKNIAQLMVDTFVQAGVERVYGLPGDSLNGFYDCHRSRVPVLAIAAQIPSNEIGSGYFQETDPGQLFAKCSHYCELVSHPEQMPRVLEIAMQTAISKR